MVSNIINFKEDKMKQFQLRCGLNNPAGFREIQKMELGTAFETSMSMSASRPTLCHYNVMFIII